MSILRSPSPIRSEVMRDNLSNWWCARAEKYSWFQATCNNLGSY
jgi:hypothetical protein